MVATSPQPAVEAAIWLAFAPGTGHFTAVAVSPHHLLAVARLCVNTPYIKLMRAGEQVRTADVIRTMSPEEGDLAVLYCHQELPHVLRLLPADDLRELSNNLPVSVVGYRDCLRNALGKKAVVLHWSNATFAPAENGQPRLSISVQENEVGGPVLDVRQRLVGIATRSAEGNDGLVVPVEGFYEHNRKWKIPLGPPPPRVAKAPTMAQSLALMHLVAAQHEEHEGQNNQVICEHYRAALRLDASAGAAHLGLALAKTLQGEIDEEVVRSLGRACELLPASEWAAECDDTRLRDLLRSSKHLHGVINALRADLKKGRPLAEWAALGRAVADLVHSPDSIEPDRPRPPERAAGRLLLWAGQPRSVIAIPAREQPDILRAAAFLLVDHPEQALFWLDDPQAQEGGDAEAGRLETTQQIVEALRWIARCREGMFDLPAPREVAEKHASVLGKLMPGGDVLSWHAHAIARAVSGDIAGGAEDLDRALRGLSAYSLPGRWAREFPGFLPTPAQLSAAFGRVVLTTNSPKLARQALEKLPMAAPDDAHASELSDIEHRLREAAGLSPGKEISPERALIKVMREDPRAARLARTLAQFANEPLPITRLGDFELILPVLEKVGITESDEENVTFKPEFRTRIRELLTQDQRAAALHDAIDLLLVAYLEGGPRDRRVLWPHVLETTNLAIEHSIELLPATELLARVGNQRARELAYPEARSLLQRAADVGTRGGVPADLIAEIDMDLGWVLMSLNEHETARERLDKALAFYDDMAKNSTGATPHRRMARIHYTLARLSATTGDSDSAHKNACRAIDEADRGFEPGSRKAMQIYTSLTHLFTHLGDHLRARKANARINPRERETRMDLTPFEA
jgi:tetratricopeptide (TPR) repeat protein